MDKNVSDYFQASKELAAKLSELHKLKAHTTLDDDLHLLGRQLQLANERVDEFLEIFTWETRDTDLIRSAFLEIAKNTRKQIREIQQLDAPLLHVGIRPKETSEQLLIENTNSAFRKALSSNGRYVPRVDIPIGLAEWCYQLVEHYLHTLSCQLQRATFDNLLEAVTYFEKSSLLLELQYHAHQKTKRY